jgi:NAD(P)-dependent dehydrogenase (short-subunit alcohol dehydrogenase family)
MAPIWIVDDASPLSEGVAQALESKGYASKVVSPFTTRIPEHLGGLVIPAPVMGADSNFIRDAFALLQRCAPALHAAATEGDAVFFTLSRLDGAFGFDPESMLQDPISGGLAGLSKTAAHEWKDITCRALDIDPLLSEQEQINAVVQELEHAGPQEIGISRCGIFTPVLQNESLLSESSELNLNSADVVIISGGGRGVTAEVALHLAQHASPTLLLLGRSPLEEEEEWLRSATTEAEIKQTLVKNSPEKLSPRELNAQCQSVLNQRELRRNIERLQQAGSQVLYHALDIRDEEAVKTAVEAARSHGAIRGIIHGAGVLADKSIEDKTLEQFDLVYSTKIGGLQAIIQATAADEVDFIALFSSSTGRFGRTGQIDYAVANEVLNKTAQALARQYPQRRILSLNWGPWDGGMVNSGLKKLFASEGIEVIDLEEGSRYLLQELGGSAKEVELVILGGGTLSQPDNDSGINESQNVSDQLPNPVMHMPVSCTHLPCLRDHVIGAKAVVPMALSAEWLAQGAMHNFPGLAFFGFDNLRIYRGITLNQDEEQHIELRCDRMEPVAAQRGIYRVAVQVCDAKSATIFSSAEVILADTLPQEIPEPMSGDISAANQENRESIYADSRLFHGPAFQALEQVLGQDERGISALASNAATPAAWVKTPLRHNWLSAPMLLDSSFQLMILWCSASCGCVSLPSSVRCYRQYVEHIPGDVSEIRAHVIRSSDSGAEADIDFIAPDTGKLLARIEGYTCTMTPSLQDAFTRNTLD